MTQEQLVMTLLPTVLGPIAIGAVGWWIKAQMGKLEQVSNMLIELQHIREKQTEIKLNVEKLNELRDKFILLESEVKTQWVRIDELKDRVRSKES